jgi:hypothetical protein
LFRSPPRSEKPRLGLCGKPTSIILQCGEKRELKKNADWWERSAWSGLVGKAASGLIGWSLKNP